MQFPNDAVGDALRRIEAGGMDFNIKHIIDFNIDLNHWPPNPELLNKLTARYKEIKVIEPDKEFDGYIQFQINDLITYELVIKIQNEASKIAAPYGGICETWGVWSGT